MSGDDGKCRGYTCNAVPHQHPHQQGRFQSSSERPRVGKHPRAPRLGWLGDRFDKRRVIASAFAMMCGGLICFGFATPKAAWLLIPFLVLFGIGYGGNNTLRASVIREFFGKSNFGAIHGFVLGIMALGSIAGPPVAGWVFDNRASYQPIWLAFAGISVAAMLVVITTSPVNGTTQPANRR